MATLIVSEQLKARVKAQATAEGFKSAAAFLEALVDANDAGAPPEVSINSEEELEALLLRRIDGPWVDMDATDFARIRAKFIEQAARRAGQ